MQSIYRFREAEVGLFLRGARARASARSRSSRCAGGQFPLAGGHRRLGQRGLRAACCREREDIAAGAVPYSRVERGASAPGGRRSRRAIALFAGGAQRSEARGRGAARGRHRARRRRPRSAARASRSWCAAAVTSREIVPPLKQARPALPRRRNRAARRPARGAGPARAHARARASRPTASPGSRCCARPGAASRSPTCTRSPAPRESIGLARPTLPEPLSSQSTCGNCCTIRRALPRLRPTAARASRACARCSRLRSPQRLRAQPARCGRRRLARARRPGLRRMPRPTSKTPRPTSTISKPRRTPAPSPTRGVRRRAWTSSTRCPTWHAGEDARADHDHPQGEGPRVRPRDRARPGQRPRGRRQEALPVDGTPALPDASRGGRFRPSCCSRRSRKPARTATRSTPGSSSSPPERPGASRPAACSTSPPRAPKQRLHLLGERWNRGRGAHGAACRRAHAAGQAVAGGVEPQFERAPRRRRAGAARARGARSCPTRRCAGSPPHWRRCPQRRPRSRGPRRSETARAAGRHRILLGGRDGAPRRQRGAPLAAAHRRGRVERLGRGAHRRPCTPPIPRRARGARRRGRASSTPPRDARAPRRSPMRSPIERGRWLLGPQQEREQRIPPSRRDRRRAPQPRHRPHFTDARGQALDRGLQDQQPRGRRPWKPSSTGNASATARSSRATPRRSRTPGRRLGLYFPLLAGWREWNA